MKQFSAHFVRVGTIAAIGLFAGALGSTLLVFSLTRGSADHEAVSKVVQATQIAKNTSPNC